MAPELKSSLPTQIHHGFESHPQPDDPLRFAVIHLGPKLHYAIPAMLADGGMLQMLYTDATTESACVRWLERVPTAFKPKVLRRLAGRHLPSNIPRSSVQSWWRPSLQIMWFDWWHRERRKSTRLALVSEVGGHWLAKKAIADNFGGANSLYVHPCVSTEAVREARRRGMFIVLEATSHPFNMRVQKEECDRLGLPLTEGVDSIEQNIRYFAEEASLADVVLAASEYVKRGLIELGISPNRVAVVPYGLDAGFYTEKPQPVPGRILFVGTIDSHKGITYLADAARELRRSGLQVEFRAIGPSSSPALSQHRAFAGLKYLGQVPRAEVKTEFATADIFVFPTLTDGFGMVLLEALFAGLPIVCTPNCGDVVRDGFNGKLIPARDAPALAQAIREIVENRELRDKMSRNALMLKPQFTLESYQSRLLEAVRAHAVRRKG
jgi:glycosyltransferase involved in cell wall biosynthesis